MYNALFESIIRTSGADTDDIHSGEAEGNFWTENQLFEWVLREANIEQSVEDQKTEELIYLEDLTKMTNVLSTQKPEIIAHKSLGNIVLYAGEANKKSFGLRHIIFSRMTDNNYNKTDDEITAIYRLFALHFMMGKLKTIIKASKLLKIVLQQ